MNVRDSYEDGLSLGYEYAQADLQHSRSTGAMASELREEAREARKSDTSRAWIAFKLGIVRGYRTAVRSPLGGRWGT